MELSWSTFLLEIINFLILVWILKRFLYKPVLDVIARRRAGIAQSMTEAESLHQAAEALQRQYDGRVAAWDRERQQARDTLDRELEAERTRKLAELHQVLDQEQEKMRVVETRRQADAMHKIEETALRQGARFATRLLEQAAGPETEARLIELAIAGLEQLPVAQIRALHNQYDQPEAIIVASAFPLDDTQRRRLDVTLSRFAGPDMPIRFEQNSELLAGIRITIGAWVLGANLQDELEGFAELAHAD